MNDEVHLSAGWALWGKHPGSNSDYSILTSSSEPLTQPEFASVLTHFAPGNPPTERGLPSSLPWVIISRVGIEGQPYVGMAIQKSTDEVDSAGRPISLTSYFCVPYAEISDTPFSYASLYQALVSIELPRDGRDLIRLSVPRLDPQALATDIAEDFGEPTVLTAASLLLSGPVSIIGSDGSTAHDRLRFLDAVAAMLPYGYRADYTAATWSDSGARHQIRLAFAATARADAGVIRWRSAPAGPTAGSPGEAYFRLLRQVRERRPGQGQLTELIGFFARDAEPGLLDQPQRALESLREFDLPAIVLGAVLDGAAPPDDVREVFARSRITELPADGRQALLAELIGYGDPQDWPLIKKWWDTVVGDDPAVMLPALVATCRRLLWTPEPSLAVKEQLTLAAHHGLLDSLLAELVTLPDSEFELSGGLSAAAQVLVDWVLSAPGSEFPRTQRAMAGNQLLACELLALLAGSERETRAALTWLEPALGGFLHPFSVVLGDAVGTVDELECGQLARHSMTCIRALLQAASYAGRLRLVLPGFTSWLARETLERGGLDAVESRYWHDQAWALTPSDAASAAWLDLALLASGNDARFLLAAADGRSREQYGECFASAWSELVAYVDPGLDDLLASALITYLDRTNWTADAMQIDAVVDLTARLTTGDQRAGLESVIAEALMARPEAARRESAKAWLAQVRPSPADTGEGGILLSLRQSKPGVTVAQLVELCVRGFRADLDPAEVCWALAESRAIGSGASAAEFLQALRLGLMAAAARQNPVEWLRWFTGRFADGTFGPQIAEEFRRVAVQDARDEIGYRLDLLYIAATGGRQDSPPVLSDADIAELDWIPKSLDQILREAKKRTGRPRILGGWHGRDGQNEQHDKGAGEPGGGHERQGPGHARRA